MYGAATKNQQVFQEWVPIVDIGIEVLIKCGQKLWEKGCVVFLLVSSEGLTDGYK